MIQLFWMTYTSIESISYNRYFYNYNQLLMGKKNKSA